MCRKPNHWNTLKRKARGSLHGVLGQTMWPRDTAAGEGEEPVGFRVERFVSAMEKIFQSSHGTDSEPRWEGGSVEGKK